MKKFLCAVLSLAMLATSMPIQAFAISSQNTHNGDGEIVETSRGTFVLRDNTDPHTYIETRDLENGDALFVQYEDNQIVSEYLVKREAKSIDVKYYEDGEITTETIQTPEATDVPVPMPYGTTSGRLGRIRFQYSAVSTGICGAYVDYVKNTGSKKYDINGQYRNLAGLASFVASVLALPAAPALAISKAAFGWFGLATGAASVFIPNCELQSNYEENEYTLTNMSNSAHKNSFYGTKYKITASGKSYNDVYTEGEYYPTTSWGNQVFGMTIYSYMFGYTSWNIYAWN